ncbi:MAG: lipoprotein [Burkholderiales bacterium]|jgi:predicted small lipoprotein YifL|nr:lipoprotein [Burkholderiales bacterium]
MLRRLGAIVLSVIVLAACGQKGPLVLPEEARRKPAPPATHDVPSTVERRQ